MDSFARSSVSGKKNAIEAAYQQARQEPATLMLMEDEAGFYRQPTLAPVWAAAGRRQPRVRWALGSNRAVRAAVALNPVAGGLLHRLRSSFTVTEMGRFYSHLGQACRRAERIFLVMDNWPVHDHPRARQRLAADPRIQVLWLPTYSPWLNPAEKVWKWVRQRLTHMHPFAHDMNQLRSQIDQLLRSASQDPAALLRYTGTGNDKLYGS